MDLPPNPSRRPFYLGFLLGLLPVVLLLLLAYTFRPLAQFDELSPSAFASVQPAQAETATTPLLPLPSIDPRTPIECLLPPPPRVSLAPVYLGDDLARVPELMLEDMPKASTDIWKERKAYTSASALHLDGLEEDGFLKALLPTRPDLAGLPFVMGATCRTRGERGSAFRSVADTVQAGRFGLNNMLWGDPRVAEDLRQQMFRAYVAVLSHVIVTHDSFTQNSMIRLLSAIPRVEATRELARLAVFSPNDTLRALALEALTVRNDEGTTEILQEGLRYPWPAVAEHAARAVARLKRKDLIPQLKEMLTAPDPRGPRAEVVANRNETVAYELVRINHLRNCLLCHAPTRPDSSKEETGAAEIPVPTVPVRQRYSPIQDGNTESNLLVRIDVTYLRPAFSAMQNVSDWTAGVWRPRQRFDYLLRRRVLTAAESAELLSRVPAVSPYRRAAARALRELTGHDFEARAGNVATGVHVHARGGLR